MAQNRALVVSPKFYGDTLVQDGESILFRKRVSFQDFSAAATTVNLDVQQVDPWTRFPAGILIEGAGIALVTAFTGGAVSAATLSVGTVADEVAYVAATSVFSGAFKTIPGKTIVPFTFLGGNVTAPAVATVRVQLITTTANASALTAGKADIYLRLRAASVRTT